MVSLDDHAWSFEDECPCPRHRMLQEESGGGERWEIIYMCFVLLYMLVALISDRVGADAVMITALTLCMAARIISINEGLEGFSNPGLATVMVLFVVAEGISVTGALDWYMGKLLGSPKTAAGAQLRLMVPVSIVSAFLNNTPVVAVMIPIVQRWGKNNGISPQQLLIPLSFASILGGTCTLIGTSTNLVVVGLLEERYPNDDSISIGLFDLGEYGVPIALAGIGYILFASPFLMPGGKARNRDEGVAPLDSEEILLGARLTQWSPAAGRSVKRSGLRDTGGLYLVSVHRAATGNVHRAVGQDFVLNVGDILFFTGLVEGFGDFCEEHGLEVVTNEIEVTIHGIEEKIERKLQFKSEDEMISEPRKGEMPTFEGLGTIATVVEDESEQGVPCEVGITKESLAQSDENERIRTIHRMTDMIRGTESENMDAALAGMTPLSRRRQTSAGTKSSDPPQIVVTSDHHEKEGLVVVGINAHDRPGLLLDISKGLLRLDLQLRHTEAAVVGERSLSIWRCECVGNEIPDIEEVWLVLNALLEAESGVAAVKMRGLKVIRAVVTQKSRLIGHTAAEMDFRDTYKAAIVAVQKGGRNTSEALSTVKFNAGDVLVLQTTEESPLLIRPPEDFYKKDTTGTERPSRTSSFVSLVSRHFSSQNSFGPPRDADDSAPPPSEKDVGDEMEAGFFIGDREVDPDSEPSGELAPDPMTADRCDSTLIQMEMIWRDLRVAFMDENESSNDVGAREFLTAMEIAPNSQLSRKTAAQTGISKLPGVFLVSIERPVARTHDDNDKKRKMTHFTTTEARSEIRSTGSMESFRTLEPAFRTIDPDEPLQDGDVLWFSGSASSVGDLRRIPGLKSVQNEEVEKINERVHDRRLVQAVIARKGPLVGKTVKEAKFRTRFGAAVIAVHREGSRIHDHPGNIKLQAGDVLLLEAGPTFIQRNKDNDRSFALLAEVADSAPPRLRYLIPALVIAAAMLIVFMAMRGAVSLLICGLVASILMVLTGIMTEQEARDAIQWEIYVTIACAFGIGTALVNSGVAGGVATFLVGIGEAIGLGDAGLLGAVYFATFLISNVVTNNAAAALIFPIAMDAAEQTGTDRVLMSYCLMLAASASFMSPFGYTTNLLIYGPGGYKYKDFLRIGTPMQLVLWVLSILVLINSPVPWWASWIATLVILVVVAAVRMSNGTLVKCFSKICGRSVGEKEAAP